MKPRALAAACCLIAAYTYLRPQILRYGLHDLNESHIQQSVDGAKRMEAEGKLPPEFRKMFGTPEGIRDFEHQAAETHRTVVTVMGGSRLNYFKWAALATALVSILPIPLGFTVVAALGMLALTCWVYSFPILGTTHWLLEFYKRPEGGEYADPWVLYIDHVMFIGFALFVAIWLYRQKRVVFSKPASDPAGIADKLKKGHYGH